MTTGVWEFPPVQTLKADSKQRVRLPHARPGQVFSLETEGESRYVLVLVKKSEPKEPFPRGSLKKYLTKDRDEEQLAILKGCVTGPE